MSTSPPSDPTVGYYEAHAEEFARGTLSVDMSPLYAPFLALVRPGGHVLDAGCGAGRDGLAFKRRGFVVTAFDASPALARIASGVLGQPVAVTRFQDLTAVEEYDGVWACASLLHVPLAELPGVFARVQAALRPGGVWYMSFKDGAGEVEQGGRRFTNLSALALKERLESLPDVGDVVVWVSADQRPGRAGEKWVNGLVRRVPSSTKHGADGQPGGSGDGTIRPPR